MATNTRWQLKSHDGTKPNNLKIFSTAAFFSVLLLTGLSLLFIVPFSYYTLNSFIHGPQQCKVSDSLCNYFLFFPFPFLFHIWSPSIPRILWSKLSLCDLRARTGMKVTKIQHPHHRCWHHINVHPIRRAVIYCLSHTAATPICSWTITTTRMEWATAQFRKPPWPSSLNLAAREAPPVASPSWQPPALPIPCLSTWALAQRWCRAALLPRSNLLPHQVLLTHRESLRVPSPCMQEEASLRPAHPVCL